MAVNPASRRGGDSSPPGIRYSVHLFPLSKPCWKGDKSGLKSRGTRLSDKPHWQSDNGMILFILIVS